MELSHFFKGSRVLVFNYFKPKACQLIENIKFSFNFILNILKLPKPPGKEALREGLDERHSFFGNKLKISGREAEKAQGIFSG